MPWARATAPLRVLDAGGWTDTWFAGTGTVCHLAVGPGPEVTARWSPKAGPGLVAVEVAATGEVYSFEPNLPPGRHPLLEAVVARLAPLEGHLDLQVSSPVPPGSSLGTSAAVVVAAARALEHISGLSSPPAELARLAHRVETEDLGRQSGVQDQVAAAFGGANLVRVTAYPEFEVEQLKVPEGTLGILQESLLTVYLGAFHDSDQVHRDVIARLETSPVDAQELLEPLRQAAAQAALALGAGDLEALGAAMQANTEAQAGLHQELVSEAAWAVIDLARSCGALGWKVNGAGGPGGTVTLVCPGSVDLLAKRVSELPGARPLALSPQMQGAALLDAG